MPTRESDRLINWASDLDPKALAQAHRTSEVPVVSGHVALMADAHVGKGATIGSVVPTQGAIIPAAVGVDLGCGMCAVNTGMHRDRLPDDLGKLLRDIERRVPAGVGKGHDRPRETAWKRFLAAHGSPVGPEGDKGASALGKAMSKAPSQFGTLGSGNHFVEVLSDERGSVWLMLHSGSRGPGNLLASAHIALARKTFKKYAEQVGDLDLAWVSEGTEEFRRYITDLRWSQAYALANREVMMDAVVHAFAGVMRLPPADVEVDRVNCHHNYAVQERHFGRQVWVTRKGAISARAGERGLIPGSMATGSYVVRGLGSPDAYQSASHGAGRRLSRTAARKQFSGKDLIAIMAHRTFLADRAGALTDEHPHAYKDLDAVMRDQADLVEVEHRLETLLNYKGT